MTAARVNGLTIEYESYGDGEPLVLVMGLGGQLVAWPMDFVNRMVDRGFRVIRFDNRDIGLSSEMPGEPPKISHILQGTVSRRRARSSYAVEDMADDTAGLLDHLGIARAHLVGVSMGGMISQSLAIRHPAKVASLTSIMSNTGDRRGGRPKAALLAKLAKLLRERPMTTAEVIESSALVFSLISGPHYDESEVRALAEEATARHVDAAGMARQMMAILASPDRTADLRRLDVPTLVIHGLLDPLVRPSGGVATARAVPGSRLLMFPDMAHDLPRARWDEIIDAIVANARRGGFDRHAVDALA
jgi:pimeloyl-ACP methyl ester carboxylesterase